MQYLLVLEDTGMLPLRYRADVQYMQIRRLVTSVGRVNSAAVRGRGRGGGSTSVGVQSERPLPSSLDLQALRSSPHIHTYFTL